MGMTKILKLSTLFMAFLLLNPKMECVPTRPLCLSQISLVNHACSLLPFHPAGPPPSPPDDAAEHGHGHGHVHQHGHGHEQGQGHGHGHGHRHRHGHRHEHHETPVEEECCHWLNAMDDECVCDLLVHLPPFLARPAHQYSIMVDDSCTVTFQCGGRIRI
ncbi:uncharacterized protein LOC132309499 [Cornus florida]|uniref:uncharacterized protein LOC132309499 n=1 Tax=Cornus florida TaxID=4283 RepID=UPI0028967481|nr:uncharacterized protein LOC132309499 [Cornus florida]